MVRKVIYFCSCGEKNTSAAAMTDDINSLISPILANSTSTSSFLSGFWIGKAVQELQNESRKQDSVEKYKDKIADLMRDYRRFETSLSRNVAERIFYAPDPLDAPIKIEDLLNSQGELNMKYFSKAELVGPEVISLTEEEAFIKSGRRLYFSSVALHGQIRKTDLNEFRAKYGHLFNITQFADLILELYTEHLNGRSTLAFLGLSTVLERLLSDAWRMYNYRPNQAQTVKSKLTFEQRVPKKLSDLLLTRELKALLGEDLVFLLRAFIGPLSGINLRNILWHGFMAPHEFDAAYTSFLFYLFVTVSQQLQAPFKAKSFATPALHRFDLFDHVINHSHVQALPIKEMSVHEAQIASVKALIDQSYFVLPKTESQWHTALEFHLAGEYYKSLLLLFPLIEHSLRRIYVIVNKCADRRLTAESDVLYTTLDILLNFKHDDITTDINKNSIVDNNDGDASANKPDNKIFEELGDELMSYIYDLFVWGDIAEENLTLFHIKKSSQSALSPINAAPDSSSNDSATITQDADSEAIAPPTDSPLELNETRQLRLRDMIAHGLIDHKSISQSFSEYCWTLALCLCSKYDLRGEFYSAPELDLGPFVRSFTPRFHPSTLLLNEIEMFNDEWKMFNEQFTPFNLDHVIGDDGAKNRILKMNYPSNSLKQPAGLPPSFDKAAQELDLVSIIDRLNTRKDQASTWFEWARVISAAPIDLRAHYKLVQARGSTHRKTTLVCILRKITYHCHRMLYEIRVRFDYLKKIVDERTAWKRHRVNYSQLVELLPYLALSVIALISVVEIFVANELTDLCVTVSSGRSESVVMLTWSCSGTALILRCTATDSCLTRVTGSLVSIIQANKWLKAAELVKCFTAQHVPVTAEQLSKKDLVKLWANFHAFLALL